MAARRAPLSSNPNAANSPIRPSHSLLSKNGRTYAGSRLAERDPHQQPPAKKQALNNGGQRHLSYRDAHHLVDHRSRNSTYDAKISRERSRIHHDRVGNATASGHQKLTEGDLDNLRQWQNHHRAKFPKFVFYFEKVPETDRYNCKKQLSALGAREENFFSINVTHVITTRPIPAMEKSKPDTADSEQDQPQTINPAVLSRDNSSKRNMDLTTSRRTHATTVNTQDDVKRIKPRSNDVLHRARDMGMKIWSLDKLQRVLELLLEDDNSGGRQRGHGGHGASKSAGEPNLLQMLQNERVNGPADRDPTVAAKELHMFKGPYIYIYDVNEKLKPIMAREYAKVADKQDGDWPQFRSVAGGRCPFVEEPEAAREAAAARERTRKAARAQESRLTAKPGLGKRTLSQMQDAQNRIAPPRALFEPPKPVASKDARENAFTSRAVAPRLLAGEPVASGLQKSKITSAIQSQMISSTTGTLGAKAGTSREVQGLQRAVLQRHTSNDSTSRRVEHSTQDEGTSSRPLSQGRACQQQKRLDIIEEDNSLQTKTKKTKSRSQVVVKPKRRDPKPGYCENCQDKFDDFEEHIESRKHRRFAENSHNWTALDDLFSLLERPSKPRSVSHSFGSEF
ncbi:dfp1 him1 [Zalerion maritima]|uniref:Dfp1 him1 n=1 Tax=Zalerion maritima TaxID=339359 RepID=A0AAD5RZM5_9PEZI|nr:dfp1 him1 [Zalerion maritima]